MNVFELNADQKAIYKQLSEGIHVKAGSSADFVHYFIISAHNAISRRQKDAEERIAHNNDTLSQRLADEANNQIRTELEQSIANTKEVCKHTVSDLIANRRSMVDKYTMIPIPDDMFRQLQTLKMMTGDISEYEWTLYNKMFTSNYLANKLFTEIAKDRNVTILPAFDPLKTIDNLNTFEDACRIAIESLENPTILALSFLNDNPNNNIAKLINDLDTDIATLIPAPRRTVVERLKQAKQDAMDANDLKLSARIDIFLERNINELATPEEMKDALYEQAEELIAKSMDAKKDV